MAASEGGGTINVGIDTGVGGVVKAAPTANAVPGSYTSAVDVYLTAQGSVSIYYSFSNSALTNVTGTTYTSPIHIGSTTIFYAVAYYADGTPGPIGTYGYTISIPSGGVLIPGGGGGGGGYTAPTPTSVSGTGEVTLTVTSSGTVSTNTELVSSDNICTADINQGTVALGADGNPIGKVTVAPSTLTPPPGVLAMYDFGPAGATFSSPGVKITMKYDPAKVPAGTSETALTIAFYDTSSTPAKWVELTNVVVDTVNHTVSGYTTHFSQFAVIGASLLKPTTIAGTTAVSAVIDANGVFSDTVTAVSSDPTTTKPIKNAALTVAKGTKGLDKDGKPLTQITMVEMATPPAQPDKYTLINLPYSFGPDAPPLVRRPTW